MTKSKELESVANLRESSFVEVVGIIQQARKQALQTVNASLIELYWKIGEYISNKLSTADWGDGVVEQLARYIYQNDPNIRGFTKRNLFRMRQFYESYQEDTIVSALRTQLSWTHHRLILSCCRRPEERQFYVTLVAREKWSTRQLERQLKCALFERTVLSPVQASPSLIQNYPEATNIFKDSYVVEFLNLPSEHSETDLHLGLLHQLKNFIIELGRDFCFVGSEYLLQVGNRDFALDLLFFHRGLNSLVAIELKVGRFEPEHLGKMEFYLEALDRDVKKPHERPSIGVLLCASKDSEVAEYALSRSFSPALIAEYTRMLPDKKLLEAKLHEFYQMAESGVESLQDEADAKAEVQ